MSRAPLIAEDIQTTELDDLSSVEKIQEIKQKSVSGAISYVLRNMLLNLIGLGSAGLLAFYLRVEDFGIYTLVSQIIGLLTFFSDIGLAAALVQQREKPSVTEYRTAFTVQQALSWFIFAITLVLCFLPPVKSKLGSEGELVLLALGLSFPLASLKTIPSIILERRLEFSKLVIPQIFEQLVYNGILIYFAMTGYGIRSFTYAIVARSLIGVVVMYILQTWPIGLALNRETLNQVLRSGVKFQANDFIARIKDQLFYLVLGWNLPVLQYGYIGFAEQWSSMPYAWTVQSVIAITFPTYSRLQHDKKLLRKAIEKTLFFISASIFPILTGMCLFVAPFIQLIPRIHKWEPAVLTFILFTFSIGWGAISTPLTNTLNAIGKINTTLKLMVMWTALTWILTPILVKLFGYNGVGYSAFLISFTSVLPIYFVNKVVKINVWDQVWRQLFACVMMIVFALVSMPFWSRNLFLLLGGMTTTGLVYAAAFFLVGKDKILAEVMSLKSSS